MQPTPRRLARCLALTALLMPLAASAGLVTVTVSGTVSSGFDAYRNSVYFGADGGYNLTGMQASISITYESSRWVNGAGGNYWSSLHAPNWPSFAGTQGLGPVVSSSFTINGSTLAVDVSGAYETASLQVENVRNEAPLYYGRDAYSLFAGDNRTTWCPNDRQCVENAGISAQGAVFADLFGGQPFDPDEEWSATRTGAAGDPTLGGNVRLIQNPRCLPGSGWPGGDGMCPAGRFADDATATHWVEFLLNGTSLTVTRQTGGGGGSGGGSNGVPEPGSLALALAAAGVLAGQRRITARRGPAAAPAQCPVQA